MPNTPRLLWGYPAENQDPWYAEFQSLILAQDASVYASREDRHLTLSGGGVFSYYSTSGLLSWTEDFNIINPIQGYKMVVPAGSVTLADGEFVYVVLTRALEDNLTLAFQTAQNVPNTDDAYTIAVRIGDNVYFRFGRKLPTGASQDIFLGGGGPSTPTSDTYERFATFGIAEGSSTQEATLGRILYPGALTGLSAEITRPVSAGSITINAKIGGVTALTVVLNITANTSVMTTAAPTDHPVSAGAEISVEVVASSYANTAGEDGGLTIVLAFATNVDLVPTEIPFASDTQAGITYLSVAPAVATIPVAIGSNDPSVARLNQFQTYTKSQGVAAVSLVCAPTVAIDATLGNVWNLELLVDVIVGNPTGLVNGFTYILRLAQDSFGGHAVAFGTAWKFAAAIPPEVTTDANAVDVISAVAYGGNLYCSVIQDVR